MNLSIFWHSASTTRKATRRIMLAYSLGVTAFLLGGPTPFATPSAAAQFTPTAGTAYVVTNVNSGKCVDARAAITANGTAVQQFTCNNTAAQNWTFTAGTDGYFLIGNASAPNQVWDVTNRSLDDRAPIQLWVATQGGGNNQQWQPVLETSNTYHFVNRLSGKCLGVPSASTAEGQQLDQYTCNYSSGQSFAIAPNGGLADLISFVPAGNFVVSESQFNQMFPNRNPFYTYGGLLQAMSSYPGFAHTGSADVQKQEAAAFLANVSHETGGLQFVTELNTANYPDYCDFGQPYGCPAGQAAYYGRGPLQLSWNYNYKAAGDALHVDLLHNPWLVENTASVSWQTGLWFWNTMSGAGSMTPHNAIVNGAGFGETIRSINGALECNGRAPDLVQDRVNAYLSFTTILGVSPGSNLYC